MVASLSDILSLVRTAVLTEKPRSATAFPCEIVREAFAKREMWDFAANDISEEE